MGSGKWEGRRGLQRHGKKGASSSSEEILDSNEISCQFLHAVLSATIHACGLESPNLMTFYEHSYLLEKKGRGWSGLPF